MSELEGDKLEIVQQLYYAENFIAMTRQERIQHIEEGYDELLSDGEDKNYETNVERCGWLLKLKAYYKRKLEETEWTLDLIQNQLKAYRLIEETRQD